MVGYVKIIAILALVTICAAAGYAAVSSYNGAVERAKELEGENKTLTASLNEQIADNARMAERAKITQKLLAERETSRRAAADLERSAQNAISQIVAASPAARDWWNAAVPTELATAATERYGSGKMLPGATGSSVVNGVPVAPEKRR